MNMHTEHAYQEERKAIQGQLIKRGYKPTSVEKSLAKVDMKERETLLHHRHRERSNFGNICVCAKRYELCFFSHSF